MNKISPDLNCLESLTYGFNQRYGLSFLEPTIYNKATECLSNIRRNKELSVHDIYILNKMLKHQSQNYYKIKELEFQEPRRIAQAFIGKKNVREFIFKRDGYKCLKCESKHRLQIDHIVPISKNGLNRLGNLQTLCGSCNSKKRDTFKDYRK